MTSNSSIVALRYFVCSVFSAIVSLIILNTAAAQTINKPAVQPKAILLVELSESPKAPNQNKALPIRISERAARVTNKLETNALSLSPSQQTPERANEIKRAELFWSLTPTPLENQAFALINEQRRLQQLPPLKWDLEMLYLARTHSGNMAQLNFFGHLGLDGKLVDDRAKDINVEDWHAIGENIAFTQGIKDSIVFVVQSWMHSPHHKENLLSQKWMRSGIGIMQTSEGKFYITQVFRD